MSNPELALSDPASRARRAAGSVARLFERAGWKVRVPSPDDAWDLLVRRKGIEYAVEVKSAPEGRGDRLVPLFAEALLVSRQVAPKRTVPLAVVAAPSVSSRAAAQVMAFAARYAPGAAAGVVDFNGLAVFRGPHLEAMNAEGMLVPRSMRHSMRESGELFSDLNQWMLKVLLAPELPEALLAAPRGQYRNASELARTARVSVMSAFRFVQQLEREGYRHESASHLSLVRREDLFGRWQASSSRSHKEVAMRFVLSGDRQAQLGKMLGSGSACLALFAAADVLKLGFVHGVPPYVYVPRVRSEALAAWKNLRACAPGEAPDVVVREAPAAQSVFRAMVRPGGVAAADVLQVWLDVSAHPSRGREQAELIKKRVLRPVIEGVR